MSFDYGTLIIDRAASDSDALRALVKKPMSQWTAAEAEAFTAATLKGSYDYTDLNRVSACMEDLVARLNGLGYAVPGYERVKIERTGKPTGRLPEGYTEVEYIQSSGTQFIDTGIIPNNATRVEMDFTLTIAGTGNRCLFGVGGQFSFRWYGETSVFRTNGRNNVDFPTGISGTVRHSVEKTATETTLDGVHTVSTTPGTITLSLYLLAQHTASGTINYSSANLYHCKIHDDNTLVRDFVPCKNAAGVAGLYDLVSSQFYGNAGTGSFSAGPTVEVETDTPSDSDALDPYLWYAEDAPTRPRIEQYRGNVAAVRAVLAMPDTTPEVPESLRKPTTDEVNTIEAILVAIDLILTHIPAARRHCGVTVCGLRGVIA